MDRVVFGVTFASLLAVFALTADIAAAQCAEGRVANEQTQGRCCWPGQSWNPETALCAGAPGCPAGRVAQGDDCVLQAGVGAAPGAGAVVQPGQATGQPADPNAVPAAPSGYGGQPAQAGQTYQAVPTQPVVPAGEVRTEERINKGLLIPGIIMFSAGYGVALAVALTECRDCGWFAIPVVGPLVFMGEDARAGDPTAYYVGLIAWSLVQAAGIAMFILALTMKREVEVRADLGNGRSIALQPFETPGGAGLQLLGEF